MSWQAVCREYFVPALERCLGRPIRRRAADASMKMGRAEPHKVAGNR